MLSFVTYSNSLLGQEFMFELIFEDSEGNLDTLVFGYDEAATDTIDAFFGEENIINEPIDAVFDVRITNEWANRSYHSLPGTYHTKKQITKKPTGPAPTLNIDIMTKNWPVTMRWDSTLFMDPLREGSLITSVNPGGWWDTGSPSDMARVVFGNRSHATFTSNHQHFLNENYSYINNSNDTIPTFWQVMSTVSILESGVEDLPALQDIKAYPNPTTSTFTIVSESRPSQFFAYTIYDIAGRNVRSTSPFDDSININDLSPGVYMIHLSDRAGTSRIVKVVRSDVD